MYGSRNSGHRRDIWLTYSGICSPTTEIDLTSTFLLKKQIILICKDSSSTYSVINSLPFKSHIFHININSTCFVLPQIFWCAFPLFLSPPLKKHWFTGYTWLFIPKHRWASSPRRNPLSQHLYLTWEQKPGKGPGL